jgi:CDP-6-deoxy-D-xylo-4-hexulose-3-dehydrase
MNNLSFNIEQLKILIEEHNPAMIFSVNVLGFPADYNILNSICENNDIILIEDNCESLGTTYYGKKLGSFGLMSSHSFFISHHICTIEGGMISTDDCDLYNMLKMLRSHGWDRDLDEDKQKELRMKFCVSDFDAKYKFYVPAFNVRSTDLNAYLGLMQMERIGEITKIRQNNYSIYKEGSITITKINQLSPTEYKEEIVSHLDPIVDSSYSDKIHTINGCEGITVIDACKMKSLILRPDILYHLVKSKI